ncbi:MAG: peptidylprolyl isomerase [Chromatiaceae bacterium]|nr:peptidylprolyl isomerase [Chromatiaceae bacterium]MCF7994973.1 peptidylprolyl isomerase [Chromatiaceae bacterium]MCF8005444.1 peptidylprolyl isomerase [Chromatiaceae bacterium]MCF8015535.1 peptidylprolyl isomerase [Chromatiaceae bacterium]
MKHRLITASLLAAVISAPACAQEAQETSNETLIATVNGQPYRLDLFRAYYGEILAQRNGQDSPQLQEQAFNEFMNMVVASQEGEKRDVTNNAEVQAALALQRMMVLSAAALQSIGAETNPSEAELKQAYDELVAQSQRTEYKARHILLDDKDKAQALIEQLDAANGEGFATLAEENSLGPTAEKGGDLGWFDSRRMVKPFADAVAEMEPGSYSKQPVQTQFGWHIILLEETRAAEPPSFEQAKPQLEALLRQRKVAEALTELRNNADVQLNEEVVTVKEAPTEE